MIKTGIKPVSLFLKYSLTALTLYLGCSGTLLQASPVKVQAQKVLHVLLTSPESSFDPALASDINTISINENLFEPMLRYDYLARPLQMRPNTLQAMPEISADGKTYTMKIRPGIFFSDHPAFAGKPRELQAEDYRYSLQRLYDSRLKSPWLFLLDGKILGEAALKNPAAGSDPAKLKIPGIEVLDKYTLRIRLQNPEPNFLYILGTVATSALAQEVLDYHGSEAGNHPIGTGPFTLGNWQRSFKIELLANPRYQRRFHDQGHDPKTRAIASALNDKTLPLVDKVEIKVVEEQQARVLGFLNREFDYLEQVPPPLSTMLMEQGKLKPELTKQGVNLALFPTLQIYYVWMNMQDPVIGGYSKEKIALRRAIALSYDAAADIALQERGLAMRANSPLPPQVNGYSESYRSPVQYNVQLANALLDKFAYRRAADNYRRLPDGSELHLQMHSKANTDGRIRDEVWRKSLEAIGIRISFKSDKHSEILRAARLGKVQMVEADWIADFPDADNFYQLLYSGNIGRANYARFSLKEFDDLYLQARGSHNLAERQKLYEKMAQILHAYNPWVLRTHPLSADVSWPWVRNYLRHPVDFTNWRYLDVEPRDKLAN